MSKRGIVQRDSGREHEEYVACPTCGESDSPVTAEEHRQTCHVPRKLSSKLRYDENCPVIHSSKTFTSFVHCTNVHVDGHDLMDEGNAEHENEED